MWEAEEGGLWVQDSLGNLMGLWLKVKNIKGWEYSSVVQCPFIQFPVPKNKCFHPISWKYFHYIKNNCSQALLLNTLNIFSHGDLTCIVAHNKSATSFKVLWYFLSPTIYLNSPLCLVLYSFTTVFMNSFGRTFPISFSFAINWAF